MTGISRTLASNYNELFCENSYKLSFFDYFRKKGFIADVLQVPKYTSEWDLLFLTYKLEVYGGQLG